MLSNITTDDKLITMWLHGRPHTSVKAYRKAIYEFFDFVPKSLRECKLEDLQDYDNYLIEKNLSPASVRLKINALKSFFTFATQLNYIPFNIAAAIKPPKGKYSLAGRILSKEDCQKIINCSELSLRDSLIVKFFYYTGVRVSELCRLRWSDFSQQLNGAVQVRIIGKGEKERIIIVPAKLWSAMQELRGENVFVFHSVRGKQLDCGFVTKLIKKIAIKAINKNNISAHWLRHAHAQHTLAAGAPIHLVRDSLGHSNISITNIYLESNPEDCSSNYLD